MELYRKFRPTKLQDVYGQPQAIKSLKAMVAKDKIPHVMMFAGHSGSGKTTSARIMRKHVKCGVRDFSEMNCADIRGIDAVRDIRKSMHLRPMNGNSKLWLIDEAHRLTGGAQEAMLKILEDVPSHVYFILCTTDPNKLARTVRDRCFPVKFKPLNASAIEQSLLYIEKQIETQIDKKVQTTIIEQADGSARRAIEMLEGVVLLANKNEQLEWLEGAAEEQRQIIDLCRLLFNFQTDWSAASGILTALASADAESIRWAVIGYARAILLKGNRRKMQQRACRVIQTFEGNFYDSKHAGLAMACYQIFVED